MLLRLGLSIFFTLNIMVASWLSYSQEVFGTAAKAPADFAVLTGLFSYLAWLLATLVLVLLGLPLLADALRQLRAPGPLLTRLSAPLLITLGVFSAYLLSVLHTLRGQGSLYFDTAAIVLVFVALGSYLEAGSRQRALASACELLAVLPAQVHVERQGRCDEIARDQVAVGDRVRVRPGETVPVDGRVVSGCSQVLTASLTGEAQPRTVEVGDRLLAGAISLDGQLWLETERVGAQTVLAQMEASLTVARGSQPAIQRLADQIAGWFVPGVVFLALGVFAASAAQGAVDQGLLRGLSVLLISCPCALGLAAPLSCWSALRRAAEQGILIDSATTLERAALVDHLFFDKTGTLTEPELVLGTLETAPGVTREEALTWAASLEAASMHPIARAVLAQAQQLQLTLLPVSAATVLPGRGLLGQVGGRLLRLGSEKWVSELGLTAAPSTAPDPGATLFLLDAERVLARLTLCERLRPAAPAVIRSLEQMGIAVSILSGDRSAATCALGSALGVRATGELLPADKVEHLRGARTQGARRIAMVGDGLNDAPVLAAADVGIALGSASDLARRSGNVRLISDRLDRLPILFALARDTRRRIRTNLLWAFAFNSVGILLAAAGYLTPIIAAAAMAFSSSLVVIRIARGAGAPPASTAAAEASDASGLAAARWEAVPG